jgi:LacI family transcriptional regulator
VEALRDVLPGIISYSKAQNTNWELQCVDLEEFEHRLAQRDVDGAIAHINPRSRKWLNRMVRSGVPIVNTLHDSAPRLACVLSDDQAIGQTGAEYYLARGYQNFAFLGIDADWSRNRQAGFTQLLRSRSDTLQIMEKVLPQQGHCMLESTPVVSHLRDWARKLPKPVAVMTCSDLTARSLLTACEAGNISIPDQMSILGVDNLIGVCELASVPLSSVSQNFPMIGVEAARTLDRMMQGGKPKRTAMLVPPGAIIVRRSTDVFAFEDQRIAAAMRMIHEQAGYGLGMKQLIRSISVSRTWLDLRFRKLIGHTPSEEIRRIRLNRVRELLVSTDLSVQEIAIRCGFGSTENLTHFFNRAQKVAPLDYRRNHRDAPVEGMRSWSRHAGHRN